MPSKQITNPNGAFGETSDVSNYVQWVESFKNTGAAAIAAGDAVALKYTATGTLLEIEGWDTDASGQNANTGVGVALDPIAVNATGRVVVFGYARVQVAGGTAAKGNQALGSTTSGVVTPTAADATTIVGQSLGVFLGVKDASNLAPIWVSPR
jgi:hypothetical protein